MRAIMRTRLTALAILLVPAVVLAQDPAQIQRLFESGKYQQVVESTTPDSPPDVLYTTAQSQLKLGAADQAAQTFGRLAERPEADPWHFVGLSGRQLVEGNIDAAIGSARQAVAMAPDLPYSHFQLGLTLARQQAWAEAATEFDAASEREPSNAYAHYYGGMMHYRANRIDRMAVHFDQFLKLAPEAPERPEVMSIMRTLQGR
jgi:outer membrane protein assembly factor BamD (BamD/ComL family)